MNKKPTKGNCPTSKNRYHDDDTAQKAARESMLFRDSPILATYFCMICKGFHLTSSIKEKKVKRKVK